MTWSLIVISVSLLTEDLPAEPLIGRFQPAVLSALGMDSAERWWLGLSGGMDSVVLLHALILVAGDEAREKLQAVHIHHGLSSEAHQWEAFCEALCERLGVPLFVERIKLPEESNLEAQARRARYAVFAKLMSPGDVLLTAHHQDDQAETLLLRLMRGAGVRGLRAMQRVRVFAGGIQVRPMLSTSREEIAAYARQHGLDWVEDGSNQALRFDRNYLRQEVLPSLRKRWPGASASIAESAHWCEESDQLTRELGEVDLNACRCDLEPGCLDLVPPVNLTRWLTLSEARQRNLIQVWLRALVHYPLRKTQMQEWIRQLQQAGSEAAPLLAHEDVELRVYQGRLHCLVRVEDTSWAVGREDASGSSRTLATLNLRGRRWVLVAAGNRSALEAVRVCWRSGGETVHWEGKSGSVLKKQLQDARVPPWERDTLPMVCAGEAILWSVWFGDSQEKTKNPLYQKLTFDFRMESAVFDDGDERAPGVE